MPQQEATPPVLSSRVANLTPGVWQGHCLVAYWAPPFPLSPLKGACGPALGTGGSGSRLTQVLWDPGVSDSSQLPPAEGAS